MALISAQLELIPVYLEAKSKKELVMKMFLTNKLNVRKYNYMSPMLEKDVWVVWFYADIKNYKSVDDLQEEEKVLLGDLEL